MKFQKLLLKALILISIFGMASAAAAEHAVKGSNVLHTSVSSVVARNRPPDSIHLWSETTAGLRRYEAVRRIFPPLKDREINDFLTELAWRFEQVTPAPHIHYKFYVADTLNPALWPAGGGYFIIHAGLLRHIQSARAFAFLITLEMAHDWLGHNVSGLRAFDRNWHKLTWGRSDLDAWGVGFWTMVAGTDPILKHRFYYSLQQESDALELVYRLFKASGWNFNQAKNEVVRLLPSLNTVAGTTGLTWMHHKLALAAKLPFGRLATRPRFADDALLDEGSYQVARQRVGESPLQHYQWMINLVPYRPLVFKLNKTLTAAELNELKLPILKAARSADSAKSLARDYVQGLIYQRKRQWKKMTTTVSAALKIAPSAAPFLWQQTVARMLLGQYRLCIQGNEQPWVNFDHRRRLLNFECTFLSGRYSDAQALARSYRRDYPYDVDGAIWQALIRVRLKEKISSQITHLKVFWGDRPMVRAIEALRYGAIGKPDQAWHALKAFQSDIEYSPREWGLYEFATAWLHETYDVFSHNPDSFKPMARATRDWPLILRLRENFPRAVRPNTEN